MSGFLFAIAAGLMALRAPATAQGGLAPGEGPAERRLMELVAVVESGSSARIRAYVREAYAPEVWRSANEDRVVQWYTTLYGRSRGFAPGQDHRAGERATVSRIHLKECLPARGHGRHRVPRAGAAYSTAGDLFRFAEALQSGRILRPETVQILFSPKPDSGNWGYGFDILDEKRGLVAHGGTWRGQSNSLDLFTGSGYTSVILSSYSYARSPLRGAIWMVLP